MPQAGSLTVATTLMIKPHEIRYKGFSRRVLDGLDHIVTEAHGGYSSLGSR